MRKILLDVENASKVKKGGDIKIPVAVLNTLRTIDSVIELFHDSPVVVTSKNEERVDCPSCWLILFTGGEIMSWRILEHFCSLLR